jgi:hypothetical protein
MDRKKRQLGAKRRFQKTELSLESPDWYDRPENIRSFDKGKSSAEYQVVALPFAYEDKNLAFLSFCQYISSR